MQNCWKDEKLIFVLKERHTKRSTKPISGDKEKFTNIDGTLRSKVGSADTVSLV
jgi:hypothetical protein